MLKQSQAEAAKKCIGYANLAPHLKHEFIYIVSTETFNLCSCILKNMHTMPPAKVLFGAYFIFNSNIHTMLLR